MNKDKQLEKISNYIVDDMKEDKELADTVIRVLQEKEARIDELERNIREHADFNSTLNVEKIKLNRKVKELESKIKKQDIAIEVLSDKISE